jgi:RimJ/RimL family protein N-acetyltransferase
MDGPLKRTAKEWWAGNQRLSADVHRPLSIVFPETDELAGVCGFLKSPQSGEWEIWLLLRSRFWGNAIGAEVTSALVEVAFSSLAAQRVIGIVDPGNQGSLSMITRLGFSFLREYSGTLPWQQGHHIYGIERHMHNPAVCRALRDKAAQRRSLLR